MPPYNHMLTVAFEVRSNNPDGEDLTIEDCLKGMKERMDVIRHEDNMEAFAVIDSYDEYKEE